MTNNEQSLLESHGYRVLRFWNNDVLSNIDGVLTEILRAITTTPTPNPSPHKSLHTGARKRGPGGE